MRVGIVGCGFVGNAVRETLRYQHEVHAYDPLRPALGKLEDAFACDVIFVCVPTPRAPGGACDTSIVESVLSRAFALGVPGELAIKSTVPPGFCWSMHNRFPGLEILHAPEFLTQRIAHADFAAQRRVLIGNQHGTPLTRLEGVYRESLPGVFVYYARWEETELAKLAINGTGALLVSWWNELRQVADALGGVSFHALRELVLSDGRIGSAWSEVPGPDGELGFGGACLPKDLEALIAVAQECEVRPSMACAAWAKNREVRGDKST